MPTYQYACTECGHAFDIVQSFSEDSLTVCPECGGRLRKVFNAVGVVFKGSGFYRTDSRGKTSAQRVELRRRRQQERIRRLLVEQRLHEHVRRRLHEERHAEEEHGVLPLLTHAPRVACGLPEAGIALGA